MNSIEKTLKELSQVMAAHRRALAMDGAPAPIPAPVFEPAPAFALDDPRAAAVHGLMHDVQRIAGIQVSDVLEQKIVRLFAETGADELDSWIRHLRLVPDDHPQWQALVESLTVHETYFHRDRPQLDYLANTALPAIIEHVRRTGRRSIRIWSAGCATGEEAFSLAIIALDAMVRAGCADELTNSGIHLRRGWSIDVLGTDISETALRRAKHAEYSTGSLSSFRDLPQDLIRFFPAVEFARSGGTLEPSLRRVRDDVRRIVRFRPFNLIASEPPEFGFDIIACRNVMIYLAPSAARTVQQVLHDALRPGGYLLLGPTDSLARPSHYEMVAGTSTLVHRRREMPE
ncbi:MAG: protein-glutamate O-methyltransferase CheR [Alphaproteobacteria bacterium]|nr:protein-glutamate O-methyltransferase CheR [Alphaproteobacteria bacterium]